nr:hypothetical protein [Burkholderia ubonensis]
MKTWSDLGIDTRGHVSGEVKTTCPKCSPHRKKKSYRCLNLNLDKSVWNCWHCGWSGTLKSGEWQKPEVRRVYSKPKFVKAETVPIQYTVGGGRGVERSELIIFSWDDAAEPVGLF